jgi:hypothetical protein
MSYFGLKSQIFLNNCEWGIINLRLRGLKKNLEGRTLATSDLSGTFYQKEVAYCYHLVNVITFPK